MIHGPKTVLLADDDDAVRLLYEVGLPPRLPGFQITTVRNGQEAIAYLTSQPVAVLVTDIAMPVKDGFEVMAHVRNHLPNLPVVVIAAAAPASGSGEILGLGAVHVLQKPVAPEVLAERILRVHGDSARGRMAGLSLATLLQLVHIERKSCALHVRSGESRGRLHFLSGELVNAYAFELDAEGEAAARHLLSLDDVTIEFERSLHNHVRTIHTPLVTLLLDTAREADEHGREAAASTGIVASPFAPAAPKGVGSGRRGDALGVAVGALQAALPELRQRTERTLRHLDEAMPALLEGTRAVAAARERGPQSAAAEARMAAARDEVAELATRLLRAADAFAATERAEA